MKGISTFLMIGVYVAIWIVLVIGEVSSQSTCGVDYTVSKGNRTLLRLNTAGQVIACNETIDLCAAIQSLNGTLRSDNQTWSLEANSVYRPLAGSVVAQGPDTFREAFDGLNPSRTTGAGKRFLWYGGKAALRAGQVSGVQWDDTNIGFESTAFGSSTTASGNASMAFGILSTASGIGATSFGQSTRASAPTSTSFGINTVANGLASTAAGINTQAVSLAELTVGVCNAVASPLPNQLISANTDPVLTVGNGGLNGAVCSSQSNAITVIKNGDLYVSGNIYYSSGNNPYPLNSAPSGGNCRCLSGDVTTCRTGCVPNNSRRDVNEQESMQEIIKKLRDEMEEMKAEMRQLRSQVERS